jgi:hypothetical protein
MVTANDVVKRALRLIEVIAAGETPAAEDAQDALTSLNRMLHGLELHGIYLGHTDLALADTVNLPDGHIDALENILAVRLAPEFGANPSPIVVVQADSGQTLLESHYQVVPTMEIDGALRSMPSQNWGR